MAIKAPSNFSEMVNGHFKQRITNPTSRKTRNPSEWARAHVKPDKKTWSLHKEIKTLLETGIFFKQIIHLAMVI